VFIAADGGKFLQFARAPRIFPPMTEPLALVVYEKILPGTQLVNRLQDLHYRVQVVPDADQLTACAQSEMPMLVLADLTSSRENVCAGIRQLRQTPATSHIPVIAFGPEDATALQPLALAAGATLVTSATAILNHLPELLEQALRVE
jgi:CheY-like chemotaxis protein